MKKTFITLLTIIAIVFICVGCSQGKGEESKPNYGNVTIQYFNYTTEDGVFFYDYDSLGIVRFELNGMSFQSLPFTLYNLPGNQYYSYTIKAYDAEGTLMASGSGQFSVVEDFTTTQTATLIVKHQHTFKDEWFSDATYHWHEATCGHSLVKDRQYHNFVNGECTVCGYSKNPKVGDIGPAGGYIFYDKGSYSDGWRYLEAASADLRVVNGLPTIDSSLEGYSSAPVGYVFGYYRTSDNGPALYVNGTQNYNSSDCTGTDIGTGKSNTQLLISAMGTETSSENFAHVTEKTGNYAARLCDELVYTVGGVTYDDWFLPSNNELCLMYTTLGKKGLGNFAGVIYWSSSEFNNTALGPIQAYGPSFNDDFSTEANVSRDSKFRVRPVRAF